jgi:hypothetical protein
MRGYGTRGCAIAEASCRPPGLRSFSSATQGLRPGLAQGGVDAGLISVLLAEPAQQVGVQSQGNDFFRRRHNDPGAFEQFFIRGRSVELGLNSLTDAGGTHAPQAAPRPCPRGAWIPVSRCVMRQFSIAEILDVSSVVSSFMGLRAPRGDDVFQRLPVGYKKVPAL